MRRKRKKYEKKVKGRGNSTKTLYLYWVRGSRINSNLGTKTPIEKEVYAYNKEHAKKIVLGGSANLEEVIFEGEVWLSKEKDRFAQEMYNQFYDKDPRERKTSGKLKEDSPGHFYDPGDD